MVHQAVLYGTEETVPVPMCKECHQVLPRKIENTVSNSSDVYQMMRALDYHKEDTESFLVFSLNTKNSVIDRTVVAKGGINTVHVHPSDVVRPAVLRSCTSVIVAHNHPSGDPTPSPDDRILTERLTEACGVMGIRMLDHVIIAHNSYYSFSDGGCL